MTGIEKQIRVTTIREDIEAIDQKVRTITKHATGVENYRLTRISWHLEMAAKLALQTTFTRTPADTVSILEASVDGVQERRLSDIENEKERN